jgi:LysM repeat protein
VLPKQKVAIFLANLNDNEDKPLASWKTYTVKAGERPETLAARYHISVAELNQANNIGGRRHMVTGQTILVPAGGELEPVLADVAAPAFVPVAARSVRGQPRGVARAPARKTASRVVAKAPPKKPVTAKPAVRKPIAHTASR